MQEVSFFLSPRRWSNTQSRPLSEYSVVWCCLSIFTQCSIVSYYSLSMMLNPNCRNRFGQLLTVSVAHSELQLRGFSMKNKVVYCISHSSFTCFLQPAVLLAYILLYASAVPQGSRFTVRVIRLSSSELQFYSFMMVHIRYDATPR